MSVKPPIDRDRLAVELRGVTGRLVESSFSHRLQGS
jgi:hypothetical protein